MEYKTNKLEPNLTAANGQRDLCYLWHLWPLVDELRESSMFYEKDMARYMRKLPAKFGKICILYVDFDQAVSECEGFWLDDFGVLAMTKVTFSGVSLEHN